MKLRRLSESILDYVGQQGLEISEEAHQGLEHHFPNKTVQIYLERKTFDEIRKNPRLHPPRKSLYGRATATKQFKRRACTFSSRFSVRSRWT